MESIDRNMRPLLGNTINKCNSIDSVDEYSNCRISDGVIKKDAAALCQFVYACDPNRSGSDKVYGTVSGNWKPYYIDSQKSPYAPKMLELLKKFQDNSSVDFPLSIDISSESLLKRVGYDGISGIFSKEKVSLENRLANRISGFFSMIFYRKCSETTLDIAYVTAGTTANLLKPYDIFVDNVLTNIMQFFTGASPQYTRSIQNAKILAQICNKSRGCCNLYFFGHSLGGGMAVVNALSTGKKAVVFNQAGVNSWRKLYGLLKGNNNKITSYYTKNDFLTTGRLIPDIPSLVLKPLSDVFASPNLDGNRILISDKNLGHSLVDILTEFGLNTIPINNIDVKKGF